MASQTTAGATFTPQYHLTDHLGSTRVVVNADGDVLERNDYYPYGKRWSDAGSPLSDNRYRFNGKEEQSFLGLPFADYGARQYNPTLGRWFNIDPLAELDISVSPFAFCANNTLSYIDIDGNIKWPVPKMYNGGIRRHENNCGAPRGAGRTHKGIDINIGSKADDFGAPVYATHDGVVTRVVHINSGDKDAGGTRIQITSNGGEVSTFYMHLATIEDNIQKGVYIHEGVQIGTLGGSGNGIEDRYTPHLHYEIRINGELVNPAIDKTDLLNLKDLIRPIDGGEIESVLIFCRPNKIPINIELPEIKLPELKL